MQTSFKLDHKNYTMDPHTNKIIYDKAKDTKDEKELSINCKV